MNTLELETEQQTRTSTKLALGFVMATAMMVVASFAAALIVQFTQPKATAVTPLVTSRTSTFAAPGVTISTTSMNGVTYDGTVISTHE